MSAVRVDPAGPLRGEVIPPADKSVSHRAALLAGMSSGTVRIGNFLDAADTNSTLAAVKALGAQVSRDGDRIVVHGVGLRGAAQPSGVIDVGNAGTLMRLLPGWLAGQKERVFVLDGDASIRRRPVDRIAVPLAQMGARIEPTGERFPPLTVTGGPLRAITYELPVASAQVKSCVLLAALLAAGETTIVEPEPSRDHTERMLTLAGVPVRRDGSRITVGGIDELQLPDELIVPADPSSAAFWQAAATLVPGSDITVLGCGVNRTRTGFIEILRRMGGIVEGALEDPVAGAEIERGEPTSDLATRAAALRATTVDAHEVPAAIDELPLVGLLGCFAEGETIVRGAEELRVKESDRVTAVVEALNALGGDAVATPDGFVVRGSGGLRGGRIDSGGDHRMAMLGAIAGLASREGVEIVGMDAAAVSYPGFLQDLARLR
ncbi:unannotated protein [freshwater metagenome]|uniref:3-phosphoshikimate 1-carboxyvinyltransferase n=1 Tax=freshwater metagenome TaxID=449393 RepID=A0A6J7CX32_9ZZZZ|nr:3-phosphoshikimate 1-carboxyvinyltransferase [Actinomycetota bacterium]